MNFTDFRAHDIIEHPDRPGELWLIVYASPDKLVVQRTMDVMDVSGWRKVDAYQLTGDGTRKG